MEKKGIKEKYEFILKICIPVIFLVLVVGYIIPIYILEPIDKALRR
jgi:hypothetical protein